MPIEINFDKRLNILFVAARGQLTLVELHQAGESILSSGAFPATVNTIWDMRQIDAGNINQDFLRQLITMRQQKFQQRLGAKLALVANSDLKFGLGRMYEMLSAHLQQTTCVFRDIQSAITWLTSDEEQSH